MQPPKPEVLKRFLDIVASYVPLSEAVMVTLGGKGMEAKLWKARGVLADNGWLIEHKRSLSHKLISSLSFRHCGTLAAFPKLFQGVHGKEAGIDGFHLDLCGTLEPRFRELKGVLPLVSKSRGRCFAITVADQRRNLSLEHFEKTAANLTKVIGKNARDDLFAQIMREQEHLARQSESTFDPEKGAKREAGVFLNIALSLSKFRGPKVPVIDVVERYVYVSTYNHTTFRMRSYFLRLNGKFSNRKTAFRQLAELWQKSSLFFYDNNVFETNVIPQLQKERVMSAINCERLEALAIAAGGQALEQFNALKKAVQDSAGAENMLSQIKDLVSGSVLHAMAPRHSATTSRRGSESAAGDLEQPRNTNAHKLDVALNLLRAATKGEKELEKAYKQAYEDLRLTGRKYSQRRARKVGGMFARTQGKFRGKFVRSCVEKYGQNILAELAQLYTELGQPTGESQLQAEAAR